MSILKGVFLVLLGQFLTIVKGDCDSLPVIQNTYNNATGSGPFRQGYVVKYSCNTGYMGEGSGIYVCSGNDFVGNFSCIRLCGRHDYPKNGRIVGNPEYKVGTRIEFACNDGYEMQGSSLLLCRANGNWRPLSAPTCKPVDCGQFGSIANADIFQENPDGVLNDYKSVVHITCDEGYVLEGSPTVTCLASGSWSPKPSCSASSCGQHPSLQTNCIAESSLSGDGSTLTILCLESTENRSVNVMGSGAAFCYQNEWDELDMGCICDCRVDKSIEGVVYHNLQDGKFVKHKRSLSWDCQPGYSKTNTSPITCNDGEMKRPSCTKIEKKPTTPKPNTPDTPHVGNRSKNGTDIKCETKHWVPICLCFLVSVCHVILCLVYLVQWCLRHEQEKKYNNFTWWYWAPMGVGIVIAIILCVIAGTLIQRCHLLELIHLKTGSPFKTWHWVAMILGMLIILVLDVTILLVIEKYTEKGELENPKECVPLNDKPPNDDKPESGPIYTGNQR